MIKVFYKPERLVSHVLDSKETFDVLTIDLFDTLVVRRVHDPDQIKVPVAVRVSEIAEREGLKASPVDFLNVRNDFETADRRAARAAGCPDAEAFYPEFMQNALRHLFKERYTDLIYREVRDFELEIEASMIVLRERFVDMLCRLKAAGKTIAVVSDVYLPAEYLKVMLKRAGFKLDLAFVYSSADTRKAKASGAAYGYVSEKYGCKPERWLHVGDNTISDGSNAEKAGIKAVLIRDTEEYLRKNILEKYAWCTTRPFWRGRYIQQLMQPLEAENAKRSDLYIAGYNFFGFLLSAFIWGLGEHIKRLNIRRVYFFSREGYLLMKIWESLVPYMFHGTAIPEAHYLRVSRLAVMHTSCGYTDMNLEKAMIAFMPANNLDFTDFCRVFGLDADKFEDLLRRHSLPRDGVISTVQEGFRQANLDNFKALLGDAEFQERIRSQCRPANLAFQRYLAEEGMLGERDVALVDVGWLGTIHRFLFESIEHLQNRPSCHGFLMAADRRYAHPFSDDNYIHGIIYDRGRGESASGMIEIARGLFEDICQVPSEPGLVGYRVKGGSYELNFDSGSGRDSGGHGFEKVCSNYYEDLQKGAVDAAERFGAAMAVTNYTLEDLRPWVNHLLVSRLGFPSGRELRLLRPPSHPDELNRKAGASRLLKSKRPPRTLWERSPELLTFFPLIKMYHYARKMAEWYGR